MPKAKGLSDDPSYAMRPPGRPRKSAELSGEAKEQSSVQESEGKSLRFEMRLPPGMVADLELMRENTGNTYANYIRRAILRALEEDKKQWAK
jgi:hypothetical protein